MSRKKAGTTRASSDVQWHSAPRMTYTQIGMWIGVSRSTIQKDHDRAILKCQRIMEQQLGMTADSVLGEARKGART